MLHLQYSRVLVKNPAGSAAVFGLLRKLFSVCKDVGRNERKPQYLFSSGILMYKAWAIQLLPTTGGTNLSSAASLGRRKSKSHP